MLGDRLTAVTAHSEVMPPHDYVEATRFAESLGVNYVVIETNEMQDKNFVANPTDRCYHCKSMLFERLTQIAREKKIKWILDGSNYDDVTDYRPGSRAAKEFGVISPLKEAGMTKEDIRVRMAVVNEDTWPLPSVTPKLPADPKERIGFSEFITNGREVFADVIKRAYDATNKEFGTDVPPPK